jgi:hypothetical protein
MSLSDSIFDHVINPVLDHDKIRKGAADLVRELDKDSDDPRVLAILELARTMAEHANKGLEPLFFQLVNAITVAATFPYQEGWREQAVAFWITQSRWIREHDAD